MVLIILSFKKWYDNHNDHYDDWNDIILIILSNFAVWVDSSCHSRNPRGEIRKFLMIGTACYSWLSSNNDQEGDAPYKDDVHHCDHLPGPQHAQMYHWCFWAHKVCLKTSAQASSLTHLLAIVQYRGSQISLWNWCLIWFDHKFSLILEDINHNKHKVQWWLFRHVQ